MTDTPDPRQQVHTLDRIAEVLNRATGRPLIRIGEETCTDAGVRDAMSGFTQALASLGAGPGTRIALLSGNKPEVIYATHAVQFVAGVYVPMHALGSLADHLFIVRDAGIAFLIFDPEHHAARARDLAREVPGLMLLSLGPCDGATDLVALAATFPPAPLAAPGVNGSDVARIGYSGGTTGKPKSIGGTWEIATEALRIVMEEWEWPERPKALLCAPLSHAGATLLAPTILLGGSMVVLPRFEPEAVMRAIQEHRITCTLMVPTMIYALLDHPRFADYDLSSLETVFYGGSLMSPVRLKEAIERIGPVFSQFYGQAEAPMAVTLMRKAEHDAGDLRRLASCGRPLPWNRVALLDDDNNPVPDGEPGELCVRGRLVMTGYRDDPELTAATLAGGWLHTGDVAVRDEDGFVRIVDRKKDMIVSGGFNVFPRELETILDRHPAVAQSCVFGVPHEKWGEAVTAAVVLRAGHAVSADELGALVAGEKGSFQAPKHIAFVEAIPLTPVGKPDKKAMREQLGGIA